MGSKPKCNLGQVWAISILIRDHVRYSPGSYILQILKGCDQDVPSIPHVQDPFPNNKKNSRPILKTSSQTKSATGVKWISRTSSKIVLHFLKMGRHNSVICFLLPSHLLDQTWSQRSKIQKIKHPPDANWNLQNGTRQPNLHKDQQLKSHNQVGLDTIFLLKFYFSSCITLICLMCALYLMTKLK